MEMEVSPKIWFPSSLMSVTRLRMVARSWLFAAASGRNGNSTLPFLRANPRTRKTSKKQQHETLVNCGVLLFFVFSVVRAFCFFCFFSVVRAWVFFFGSRRSLRPSGASVPPGRKFRGRTGGGGHGAGVRGAGLKGSAERASREPGEPWPIFVGAGESRFFFGTPFWLGLANSPAILVFV